MFMLWLGWCYACRDPASKGKVDRDAQWSIVWRRGLRLQHKHACVCEGKQDASIYSATRPTHRVLWGQEWLFSGTHACSRAVYLLGCVAQFWCTKARVGCESPVCRCVLARNTPEILVSTTLRSKRDSAASVVTCTVRPTFQTGTDTQTRIHRNGQWINETAYQTGGCTSGICLFLWPIKYVL